jgi:hypothetical protein
MSKTNNFRVVLLLILLGGFLLYSLAYPTGTLRYRMTVEIELDGQMYSGSGVLEARFWPKSKWTLSGGGIGTDTKGEAVVLEQEGDDDIVLVLLTGSSSREVGGFHMTPSAIPVEKFNLAPSIGSMEISTIKSLGSIDARAELSTSDLPFLVLFEDPNNPASAIGLTPSRFKLHRATIETTDDAITNVIDRHLPWVTEFESAVTAFEAMSVGRRRLPVMDPRFSFHR